MFKQMKLSSKLGLGFGILIVISIILSITSWNGLGNFQQKVENAVEANTNVKKMLISRGDAKDFLRKGFAKVDGTNMDYSELFTQNYEDLKSSLESLSNNDKLTDDQIEEAKSSLALMLDYEKAFTKISDATKEKNNVFKQWAQIGKSVTDEVSGAVAKNVTPKIEKAKANSNLKDLEKYTSIAMGMEDKVVNRFLTLRISAVYLYATDGQPQWVTFNERIKEMNDGISEWKASVSDHPELVQTANNISKMINEYQQAGESYYAAVDSLNSGISEIGQIAVKVQENFDRLQESVRGEMEAVKASTNTLMIIMSTAAVILGVVLAIVITLSISKPINRIIADLTEGSEQVAAASGQVASASQSLAEGATEQAASLEETSSSLEEMSSMTKQNADNAVEANNLANEARKEGDNGAKAMGQMNEAIMEIQKSANETAKIIKVIDEIAFQTNLLALNAAVEAARAGEAGKGFAVVAEEVRNLAMRSAEAAKNTTAMIDTSVKNAGNGVEIVGNVSQVLEKVVTDISKTSDLVSEIAAASQEQAQGIDQINTAVAQMDKVTQQNASNAEESASASEELSAQASQMNGVVDNLISLVRGQGSTDGSSSSQAVKGTRPSSHGNDAFHQIASGGSSNATASKAEAEIPFEDSNFSEFNA